MKKMTDFVVKNMKDIPNIEKKAAKKGSKGHFRNKIHQKNSSSQEAQGIATSLAARKVELPVEPKK